MKPFLRHVFGGGLLALGLLALGDVALAQGQTKPTSEQIQFFEKKIRPVLVAECYLCHSKEAKKIRGGLALDTKQGLLQGGDTGPALVPGSPRRSLLIQAIHHRQDDLKMPPKKKLAEDVLADFGKWIAMGAPDPRDGTSIVKNEIDIEEGRKFWAFQPVTKPTPPKVADADWAYNDIDRFLLAKLEAKGLKPVADAESHVLLRRLYFDLAGLPPTPKEVLAFETAYGNNPRKAVADVVDLLLKQSWFGERWGRHWLDVARFGESSGGASNQAYPHAWRYRDYVIRSFNDDKPYDRFVREQLAGDLISASNEKEFAENVVATGFLAIGTKNHNERNRRQFQMDLVDEQINVTFQAFQGLTVACARCHDHKFDPIPQSDYYALAGIFQSSETCYGTLRVIQSNHPTSLIALNKEAEPTIALTPLSQTRRESIERQIQNQREQMAEVTGDNAFIRRIFMQTQIATLQSQLNLYEEDGTPKALAMGVRENRFGGRDSRLYIRGELEQPGDVVPRGFPQVLTKRQPRFGRESGRWELAEFIASRNNPLTARVMANRVWLHLFGRGIVPTVDNFGASGQPPSHPELLDHLAYSFMKNGWSVKELIRTIVTSRAYQLSSQYDEKNFEVDPDNVLVWRLPLRRLEAEALRDTMMFLGDTLEMTPPKASAVGLRGEGRATRFGFGRTSDPAESKRSVYMAIVRDGVPEVLTLFDFPDPSLIIGERSTTTIPAQSLYLMNNPFVIEQAQNLAQYMLRTVPNDSDRVIQTYQWCFSRSPTERELNSAREFLEQYGKSHARSATWTAFCQAMFASAEFSHR